MRTAEELAIEPTTSESDGRTPRLHRLLGLAVLVSLVVLGLMAFLYAPEDAAQGPPQRIFYVHVPAALVGFLAFGVVFAASIALLATGKHKWDERAAASAEVGVVFMTTVLITGPLWGRPSWGVYWSWDPRLTSSFILWLIYVSYLALRSYVAEASRRARFSAVLGIVGFLDVPLVYFSVRWWRALHPDSVLIAKGGPNMPGSMLLTLFVGMASFILLYAYLVVLRLRLERARTARDAATAALDDDYEDLD